MAAPSKLKMLRNLGRLWSKTKLRQDVYQRCSFHLTSCTSSEEIPETDSTNTTDLAPKKLKVSRAMQSYLELTKRHEEQMAQLTGEFELGEKYLAEMMGKEPEDFTESDRKQALAYLMPSGLTDKKARPSLLKAEEVIPTKKAPKIGLDGRPFHYLFYTGRPNYYSLLHEIAMKAEALRERVLKNEMSTARINLLGGEQEQQVVLGGEEEQQSSADLSMIGSEWISMSSLEAMLEEDLNDKDYKSFCTLMEHLLDQPMSETEHEFVMRFRKALKPAITFRTNQSGVDPSKNLCFTTEGSRKRAKCKLKLFSPGTGKIDINGQDISYFKNVAEREQIMFPLQLTKNLGKFDLKIKLNGEGGPSGQAGAIRYALSKALVHVVSQDDAIKMRIAGLLTADPRRRERKKPGQEGARKRYTWLKR